MNSKRLCDSCRFLAYEYETNVWFCSKLSDGCLDVGEECNFFQPEDETEPRDDVND